MKKEKQRVVLSRLWAWIILVLLVVLDASLDVIFEQGRGLESNILKPIADLFGITNPILMTPVVLLLFYLVAKAGAWMAKKIDKISEQAEELVLTTLVIVYSVFDLWLISVYLLDFTLIPNHLYLIPILIVIGIAYGWWAEKKLIKI